MSTDQQPGVVIDVVPSWDRPLITMPSFAVLGLIGGLFPSFSLAAFLYVLVLGGAMMWFGLSGHVPKRHSPWRLTRSALWWLLPIAIFLGFELANFLMGSTSAHPTLSVLADPALSHYWLRAIAYFIWLNGFWGLVRR
jgi:hypothetical protein